MPAPKKTAPTTLPNEESDGKKDDLSTLTASPPEQSAEPLQRKLKSVARVEMQLSTPILNQSSRNAITVTQGLTMWEDPEGKGVYVISTDDRVRGIDLVPWANIKKVGYETDGSI